MNKHRLSIPIFFITLGILIYSTWVFEIFLNPHLSLTQSYVSELAVRGQPYVYYFRIANLLGSFFMSLGFIFLFQRIKKNGSKAAKLFVLIISIVSIVGIINAIFPMDCSPSQSHACLVAQDHFRINFSQWVHQSTAIIMFGGLLFAQLYSTFYILKRNTRLFWFSLYNLTIQFLLNITVSIICLFDLSYVGIFQRISLVIFALWVLAILYLVKTRPSIFSLQNSQE